MNTTCINIHFTAYHFVFNEYYIFYLLSHDQIVEKIERTNIKTKYHTEQGAVFQNYS